MKRKIGYLFLILVTAAAAVTQEAQFPRFLLAFEVLFAVVMALWVHYMARQLKVSLVMGQKCIHKGSRADVYVCVENPTWFPAGHMEVEISMRDISGWHAGLNGSSDEQRNASGGRSNPVQRCPQKSFTLQAGAASHQTDQWKTEIQPVHCGLLELEIADIRVFDYIGLFSAKVKRPFHGRFLSVLPQVHELKLQEELGSAAGREGWQDDVAAKAGSDTQEIFDIRFYQRGDTLKNTHWKLSAKTDDLMIKEFSMPADRALYLAADCQADEPDGVTPDQMDRFLEMTAALAGYCLAQKNPCELLWYLTSQKKAESGRVETEADLYRVLEELLGICPYKEMVDHLWEKAGVHGSEEEILRVALDGKVYQKGHEVLAVFENAGIQ